MDGQIIPEKEGAIETQPDKAESELDDDEQ